MVTIKIEVAISIQLGKYLWADGRFQLNAITETFILFNKIPITVKNAPDRTMPALFFLIPYVMISAGNRTNQSNSMKNQYPKGVNR